MFFKQTNTEKERNCPVPFAHSRLFIKFATVFYLNKQTKLNNENT